MKLIKPLEISGKIMTLIEEAKEKMIFISPYYKIASWQTLQRPLDRLKQKNIHCEFYVREDNPQSIHEIRNAGFEPIPVPRLHTKLYMNEHSAIVSSMNLYQSSDEGSLDIAMETETQEEYQTIYNEYYLKYINRYAEPQLHTQPNFDPFRWVDELDARLDQALDRNCHIYPNSNGFQIQTRNRYDAFIEHRSSNVLTITGILSGKEFEFALANQKLFQTSRMKLDWIRGGNGNYDTVWGTIGQLKTSNLHQVYPGEAQFIADSIFGFIMGIERLKEMVYKASATIMP